MLARALFAVVGIAACVQTAAGAENENGRESPDATAVSAITAVRSAIPQAPVEPWIHHKMDATVRAKLEAGFELAVQRVRELGSCADLFDRLGADGLEMLRTGLYLQVSDYYHEIVVCGRDPASSSRGGSILGYTKVGGAPTWICRHFGRISTEAAAITILHEALHHAGLTERPADRLAMTSVEITEMVANQCGFTSSSLTARGTSADP
jgi:hypothetical protein